MHKRTHFIDKIIKKTLSGIVKAQKDYEGWSGGSLWLRHAPEYMLTTYIAKDIGAYYLTLESSVRDTLTLESSARDIVQDARGIGSGRLPEAVRLDGKIDITLWRGNDETPRAVIEVKKQISNAKAIKIKNDIIRIKHLLRKEENAFEFGLIAFCTANKGGGGDGTKARATIEERLENIECRTRKILGRKRCLSRHDSPISVADDNSAWVASVLLIQ